MAQTVDGLFRCCLLLFGIVTCRNSGVKLPRELISFGSHPAELLLESGQRSAGSFPGLAGCGRLLR
ncbi:MAG: hypothetical protein J2P57_23125, partial [Acidimicrobiaceae bacterium]|nr:hypothetical protein [Acidimicrobiaceae bacterium]